MEKSNHFDKVEISNAAAPNTSPNSMESKNLAPPPSPAASITIDNNVQTTNLSSDTILPLLKYMVLSDAIIQEHRKVLSFFIKLLTMTSLASLVDGLWIEFNDNRMTFTGFLLRTGTYTTFPMHYAIIVNGITGLICSLVCTISSVRIMHRSVGLIMTICVLCGMWAVFTLVYNFGSNIIYEDQLEEVMIHELQKSSSIDFISPIWSTSQKFFSCCGIYSFKDWRKFDNGQKSATYPPSCCDHAKLRGGGGCGESQNNVWLDGCLESESLQIMSIAYTALLISTLQFLLMIFTLMTLVKVYCRRRYLKKQTIVILAAETGSSNTVKATTADDKNKVGVIEGGDVMLSDKDIDLNEINKSSNM